MHFNHYKFSRNSNVSLSGYSCQRNRMYLISRCYGNVPVNDVIQLHPLHTISFNAISWNSNSRWFGFFHSLSLSPPLSNNIFTKLHFCWCFRSKTLFCYFFTNSEKSMHESSHSFTIGLQTKHFELAIQSNRTRKREKKTIVRKGNMFWTCRIPWEFQSIFDLA